MLLRSSSTPVLGSLLPCHSESPNNNLSDATAKHPPSTIYQAHNKLSLHQTGSLNLSPVSFNSSPISPSVNAGHRGFRRAQSDGNLKGLAYASCNNNDELSTPNLSKKSSQRPSRSMLQTIPSFSFYGLSRMNEEEENDEEEEEEEEGEWEELGDNDGERFMAMGDRELSFENIKMMGIRENGSRNVAFEEEKEVVGSEMYLARGAGVSGVDFGGRGGGGGGGGDFTPRGSGGESGDRPGVEEYYKRMLEENPSNPLFLRNYAQFLYQSKHDLQAAEEYLCRAILADPRDGEILSQYAKLVWELHRDQDRASSYFERAVQAAPEDSHVQAAYASFLWQTEEDDDDGTCHVDAMPTLLHGEAMASVIS